MNSLRTRLNTMRSEEGFTLAEAAVVGVIFPLLIVMILSATAGTARMVTDFNDRIIGQNQGDAMDTAREITDVAYLWTSTHAAAGLDTAFTKSDLITFNPCQKEAILTGTSSDECDDTPYLDEVPSTYVWTAGMYKDRPASICAAVYEHGASEGSENAHYTIKNPAMWDRTSHNITFVNACTTKDDEGKVVPRWGEVQTAFIK